MAKWEYCQVATQYSYEQVGDRLSKKHEGLQAHDGEKEVATGRHFINLFNELGLDGWEMCGQNINGISLSTPGIIQPEEIQTNVVYYFKRPVE